MPPLHIKLVLIKQFGEMLDLEKPPLLFLKTKFPKLNHAQINEGGVCRFPNSATFDGRLFLKISVLELKYGKVSQTYVTVYLGSTEQRTMKY